MLKFISLLIPLMREALNYKKEELVFKHRRFNAFRWLLITFLTLYFLISTYVSTLSLKLAREVVSLRKEEVKHISEINSLTLEATALRDELIVTEKACNMALKKCGLASKTR